MRSTTRARHETGATAVEYALLAGLIAGVIITTVILLAPKVAALYVLPLP